MSERASEEKLRTNLLIIQFSFFARLSVLLLVVVVLVGAFRLTKFGSTLVNWKRLTALMRANGPQFGGAKRAGWPGAKLGRRQSPIWAQFSVAVGGGAKLGLLDWRLLARSAERKSPLWRRRRRLRRHKSSCHSASSSGGRARAFVTAPLRHWVSACLTVLSTQPSERSSERAKEEEPTVQLWRKQAEKLALPLAPTTPFRLNYIVYLWPAPLRGRSGGGGGDQMYHH